jgi:DNA-binding NtrC family response regulator
MSVNSKILLIDDEEEFLRSVAFTLRIRGYPDVETCKNGNGALEKVASGEFAMVLLDIMMPDCSGRDLLPQMVALNNDIPIVMSTAINEIEVAVECMRAGAYDYLVKPIDKARLLATVKKALEYYELKKENQRLAESCCCGAIKNSAPFEKIVTRSESMLALFRYVEAIAPTSMPVIIYGETGTGKELFARAIHDASGRKGAFVAINVAGLDDTLFSDSLFGHERGAFTGADRKRVGLVAQAENGTLFLDEIGDLRIETQVKLLRLLEERTYFPVGADTALRANCRVVVATSVDIASAVSEGKFRKDLYYRLKSHTVRIPALRDRKEDVPYLFSHFAALAAGELGREPPVAPPQLQQLLRTYPFPGNVRELRGMVYDAVSRYTGGILTMDVFKEHIAGENFDDHTPESSSFMFGDTLPTLKEAEEILVTEALKRSDNNQSQAARLLGITPSALNKRLNKE